MKCPKTSKTFGFNQVFSTAHPGLNDEVLRGVKINEVLTRCSESNLLNRYRKSSNQEPVISSRNLQDEKFNYTLPIGYDEIPEFISDPQCKDMKKKPERLSLDELDLIIREQLAKRRHSIKCLFEENSVKRDSSVSRGTLLEILKKLCPLLDIDLFYRLLERYQLDNMALIPFRQFEEAFTAPPLGSRYGPVIFRGLGAERCVSVAQAYKMLREIACDSRFDLKRLLPPSCFEPGGRVLCPQLREAMSLMRIRLTDENYRRLWRDKFDVGHFGSIRTIDLCKILGLKEDGTPLEVKPTDVVPLKTTDMKGIPKLDKNPQLWTPSEWPHFEMISSDKNESGGSGYKLIRELPTAGGVSFPLTVQPTWEPQGPGGAHEPPFGCGDRFKRRLDNLETHQPRFEDILTCLRYRFENPYQAMLVAFKRLDPIHANRISENQCLNILREHGLPIESEGLTTFLRRILSSSEATGYGIGRDKPPQPYDPHEDPVTIRPGLVPYKRLLGFYQNRAKGSPSDRIIRELAQRSLANVQPDRSIVLTPDEIEEELVKLLHKNFIEFYQHMSTNETSPGVIHEDAFRAVINKTIGFSMSDTQWENLKRCVVYTQPQLINWEHFTGLFTQPMNIASQLTTAPFDASQSHCQQDGDDDRGDIRDKVTLLRLIEHTVRTMLHHIDKSYKHYDHKEVNAINKEDFGELLANHGLPLTAAELDYAWSLLDAIEPNKELHNYRQVMNFFYNRTRPLVSEMLNRKRHSRTHALHDPNVERLHQWRKELKQQKSKDQTNLLKAGRLASSLPPRAARTGKPSSDHLKELCEKIADTVKQNWDALQRAFIDADCSGSTKLLRPKFKEIAAQFRLPLSTAEMDELCAGFASRERDYVSYVQFLSYLSTIVPKDKPTVTLFDERRYQFTNQKNGQKLGFAEVLAEIRKACTSHWRTLQEAFKKLDSNKQGALTVEQIDQILRRRDIVLSSDDLYHLLSSFDSRMNGYVNFHDFKRTTLKTFKPVVEV